MERKPNYKRMIYWKRQMYVLLSWLSKEKGADKPERLWND
jgi:hypothetical protein